MSRYVKIMMCVALLAFAAIVYAEPCKCEKPDLVCSAGGATPCCGCGTLQSQCVSCASGYNCVSTSCSTPSGSVGTAECQKAE
jgi:hypothetical protein